MLVPCITASGFSSWLQTLAGRAEGLSNWIPVIHMMGPGLGSVFLALVLTQSDKEHVCSLVGLSLFLLPLESHRDMVNENPCPYGVHS